jgi:hypothetical protein
MMAEKYTVQIKYEDDVIGKIEIAMDGEITWLQNVRTSPTGEYTYSDLVETILLVRKYLQTNSGVVFQMTEEEV